MNTGDPLRDYDYYEAKQVERERRQPKCCRCGQTIWDDYLIDLNGDLYHEECFMDEFRHSTEDYEYERI